MKKFALLFVFALSCIASQAHAERVMIPLEQYYYGSDRVMIRQELARAGYRSEDYMLRSVTVVAEGRGMLNLVVGNQVVDSKRLQLDGTRVPNGFRVTMMSYGDYNLNRGPWQIHFGPEANLLIHRMVVDMDYMGGGGRPPFPPPGRPAQRVYNVRLESFGGILNGSWEAPRNERIISMRVLKQHSNDACIQGRSFFATSYEASVARGCRATFEIVTVEDYRF